MNASQLKGQTIAFAASGGLDSCTITKWLSEQGVKVACFTADLAQPDETDFDDVMEKGAESICVECDVTDPSQCRHPGTGRATC